MSKTSTFNSLNDLKNEDTDELGELMALLREKDFSEIFNGLDQLKCDAGDETVQKILKFAREYRTAKKQKERTTI